MANIIDRRPRLYAIIKQPDGTLVKQPVRRVSNASKLYDGFVKGISGLYMPRIVAEFFKARERGEKLE